MQSAVHAWCGRHDSRAIARHSPDDINVIGNNALIAGFARDERPDGQKVALDVCDHLDIARSDPGNADDSSALLLSVIPGSRELPESRDSPSWSSRFEPASRLAARRYVWLAFPSAYVIAPSATRRPSTVAVP